MMGPGIRDYPFTLHGGSWQKQALAHEIHKGQGMVTSSGGKSRSSTKELKKHPPHVKLSPSALNTNVSIATEKTPGRATGNSQGAVRQKERNRLYEGHQQNRATNVCTLSQRTPKPQKESLVKKHHEAGYHKIPSTFKGASWGDSSRTEEMLIQSFYCKEPAKTERNSGRHMDEAGPCSSAYQGASADAMFLDFSSVRIMKEDADEDSASDLSDSERIPIPPSPCTPPELNLRAEEIDPLCFEHLPDAKCKQSDYCYPDFLPPPFNTWDLKGLAAFVNTECKSEARPQPTGSLERYVDRLLELEWLQMQTVQAEKGKAAKARPQTAPSALWTLKSPGKNKSLHTLLPNKNLTAPESFPRFSSCQLGYRRDLHNEGASQVVLCQGHSKTTCGPSAHQRHSSERKSSEAKKRPSTKAQLFGKPPSESNSMLQGAGNIRPHKQPSSLHGSAAPLKAACSCTNPKKNVNTNAYVPSKKVQADQKLKANGVKPVP
ncbi:protein FAM217B isoform X1 [Sphaerodactylus townsendi]|uniref:protein FAM217B isoform X1 n=1 Tax=Sphaerodactylus townsendi TaxID=933632 RepID=UPI002026BE69|nr:protein FAM217B isoform X1 [Sphaerodactylus townsendi]